MNDNQAKPITDKPITVRIPLDLLENIETKASERYPSRKGTGGNRSQVILDALVFYQSHQWGEDNLQSTHGTQEAIEDEVKKLLDDNVHDIIQETVHDKLQSITDNLEYLIDKALEKRLQSTQSNDTLHTLQSIQGKTSVTNSVTPSTQDNTENKSSEGSLEGGVNENQGQSPQEENEPVTSTITEVITESREDQVDETQTQQGIMAKDLAKKIGVDSKLIGHWKKRRYKEENLNAPQGNEESWNEFLQWEIRGSLWYQVQ